MGDYSMRVANDDVSSAWAGVHREVNLLADAAQESRLETLETDILLNKLLAEFDIPAFVFDRNKVLKNLNDNAVRLFSQTKEELIDLQVDQLRLEFLFSHESGSVVEHWFPEQGGRWELRKNFFIQRGQRFMLVLINDLSRALREEERMAWQRLIRVLGHELNNSLASLTSVSESLKSGLGEHKDDAWVERYQKGLSLISERSSSLLRFTESYTKLAKLPVPQRKPTDLRSLMRDLVELVPGNFRLSVPGSLVIDVDPDQIQQLLINVMKNAVEASPESEPVEISYQRFQQGVRI